MQNYQVDPGENVSILRMNDNVYNVNPTHTKPLEATLIEKDNVSYLTYKFIYNPNISSSFYIYYAIKNVQSVPVAKIHVHDKCPIGFNLTKTGHCGCIYALQDHNYSCGNINERSFMNPQGYWTGFTHAANVSTILFATNTCPPGHCRLYDQEFELNNSLSDLFCNKGRTGNLCGNCKENYSAVFGSNTCYSYCTDLYLLTLPVYALAGLLLVATLFVLHLKVATGTVNGVIFYANMLGLVMSKITENDSHLYLNITQAIISLLNLEVGFPLCFYKGMTPVAKVAFQFIYPLYIWIIVAILVVLSKYSTWVTNLILNSSAQVLATLFYLSLCRILHNVIDIVSYTSIQSISHVDDYNNLTESTVWYYNGADYAHGIHGFYLFLAAAYSVFFLLPYGLFSLGLGCPFARFRLKPIVDAYCGPFKDTWRFWFGLRLWITVILYVIDGALLGHDSNAMFMIHLIIIGALILFQLIVQPFKSSLIMLVDTFFMLNYWLIIEIYLLHKMFFSEAVFHLAYVSLLSIAIFALFMIILYHILCLKYPNFFTILMNRLHRRRRGYENIQEEDTENDQQLFEAAEEREPVLDTY